MDLIPAVAYRRVSTADQSDNGFSLPKQQEYIERYAREHGLDIVADIAEDVSGMTPIEERPEGRKVVDLLQRREAVAIVSHETDRLSRDIVNLLGMVQRWVRAGVQVHSCDVGQVTSELDIQLVIRAWQGGSEHARILERTTRGKLGKAESGRWVGGTPPYGYQREGWRKDTRMVINETEAEVVRSIFRWYTGERLSMLAIADRLNASGIPTQRGAQWWKVIIKKILSQETYVGVVYYAGIRIDLPNLAIVDRETFERAQELRQLNRERAARNRKREYLLSGHMRCACGETMTGSTTPNVYQRTYYRCSQFQWPKTTRTCGLGAPFAAGSVVEHIVWTHLYELITHEDLLRTSIEEVNAVRKISDGNDEAELDRYERTITAASRRIDRLLREFGADDDEDISRGTKAAIRDAQRERDEAKVKRAMVLNARREVERAEAGQGKILEKVRQWRASIDQADFPFKRDVLEVLDVRVALCDDEDGQRVVEVGTALSLPKTFPYLPARQYQKMLHTKRDKAKA